MWPEYSYNRAVVFSQGSDEKEKDGRRESAWEGKKKDRKKGEGMKGDRDSVSKSEVTVLI